MSFIGTVSTVVMQGRQVIHARSRFLLSYFPCRTIERKTMIVA